MTYKPEFAPACFANNLPCYSYPFLMHQQGINELKKKLTKIARLFISKLWNYQFY